MKIAQHLLKFFGWLLLCLSGLWSVFLFAMILLNGYDCDLTGSVFALWPFLIPVFVGIGFIFLAQKFAGKSVRGAFIFSVLILAVQGAMFMHSSHFENRHNCELN